MKTKQKKVRPPRRDVLVSLRMASLEEISRPALPAGKLNSRHLRANSTGTKYTDPHVEVVSSILDYVSAVDLIRVAQSSKLLREMAYDDTRWVRKLKCMGCWSDVEARKNVEKMHGTIVNVESVEHEAAVGHASYLAELKTTEDGFDEIDMSTPAHAGQPDQVDTDEALVAMKEVRSIRGEARLEYGKIHAALAPLYEDIVASHPSWDSLVFKKYNNPESQAQILSQLQSFAKCDSTAGWRERTTRLESAVQLLETEALEKFQEGYETEDIDGTMRKYAHVLFTLNGAGRALEFFVHHNHAMTRRSDYGHVSNCIDHSTNRVKLEYTQAFLTRMSVAINEQLSIINRAFPPSVTLATAFLEQIGQDILHPFLSLLFSELRCIDVEAYLIAASGTFVQCRSLSRNLVPIQHHHDDEESGQIWEGIVGKVYEPHVDLYLAEELDHFRTVSETAVTEWDRQLSEQAASAESFLMSNVSRQVDKRDFLTSFRKVIMLPVNMFPNLSSSKSSNELTPEQNLAEETLPKSPNRLSTATRTTSPISFTEDPPTTELAAKAAIMKLKLEGISSLFSIEVALNLVHRAKSSLERAAQFVDANVETGIDARQQCEAIFVILLRELGQRHVVGGFDKAVDHLSNYRPREQREREQSGVEPLITFLELVNVGDLILQMMDVFYEQELIGQKLTNRNDFLDPAVKEKKKFEQVLDERVAAGLNKGIDVLMEEVDYILATRQQATDFNPGLSTDPHRATMQVGVTEAAATVVDVVSSHTQMLVGCTDKSTLDVFNQEVGLRLFAALCKHLKRQRISVEGSLRLIRYASHSLPCDYSNLLRKRHEPLL